MLPEVASRMLKAVARRPGAENITEDHPALDSVIAKVRTMYPGHFHTETSLHQRVFVNEPGYRIPGTWLIDRPKKLRGGS